MKKQAKFTVQPCSPGEFDRLASAEAAAMEVGARAVEFQDRKTIRNGGAL